MIRALTRRQLVVDLAIPAAILVVFVWPAITYSSVEPIALLGFCVALALRRIATLAALGVAWLTAILELVLQVSPVGPSNILIVVVLYACGAHGRAVVRWLGFASTFVGAACISLYLNILPVIRGESDLRSLSVAFATAFIFSASLAGFLLSWTAGLLVRSIVNGQRTRAVAVRAEREVVAEQERTRIARDMHDVVAHSLAVVIAQADGARYLGREHPEEVDAALQTIAGTAREALTDVRVLLGQLRHDQGAAPQPDLTDLDRLYEQFRAAGLDLRIEESGAAHPLSTSAQLAVFRIVQESLTNALRHGAAGRPVTLRFDWAPGGLHLSVSSALREGGATAPSSGGHGLAGMTERALLVGGRLDPRAEGERFVVRAWLPAAAEHTEELPRVEETA